MSKQNLHVVEHTDFAKLGHPVLVQRCETLSKQNQKIREANHKLTQHIEQEEAKNQRLIKKCLQVATASTCLLEYLKNEHGLDLTQDSKLEQLRRNIQTAQGASQ